MSAAFTVKNYRSPRLQEKEGMRVVRAIFEQNSIDFDFVCDVNLFSLRWKYDEHLNWYYGKPICRCDVCEYANAEEEDKMLENLPWCHPFPEEEGYSAIQALFDAAFEAVESDQTHIIILLALFRFLHGAGRNLLRDAEFRQNIKKQCSGYPYDLIATKNHDTENGKHLLDACWAVAFVIDNIEDEDGFDFFHGY